MEQLNFDTQYVTRDYSPEVIKPIVQREGIPTTLEEDLKKHGLTDRTYRKGSELRFNPQEIVNIAKHFADWRTSQPSLVTDSIVIGLGMRSVKIINNFDARQLGKLARAYTKADFFDKALFSAISRHTIKIKDTFQAPHLADIAFAMAHFKHKPHRLVEAITARALEVSHTFNREDITDFGRDCRALQIGMGVLGRALQRRWEILTQQAV